MTHEEVARLSGIGKRTIDAIAQGRIRPRMPTLIALGRVLAFGDDVIELLRRGDFDPAAMDALCDRREASALTGRQLLDFLAGLPPEVLGRRVLLQGRWVRPAAGVVVAGGSVMLSAMLP